jgi:hypothetical protein
MKTRCALRRPCSASEAANQPTEIEIAITIAKRSFCARPADARPDAYVHPCQAACAERLSAALVRWKWQVTLQVHLVVQDTADFDPPFDGAI